jgi:steroid delta-isomerase-like uncharacterized protein
MSSGTQKLFEQLDVAFSAHDVDGFLSLFTDDCIYEDVALGVVNKGKEELRAFWNETFTAIPNFTVKRTSLFFTGDRAATEWTMCGTQTEDIPGMPANNKSFCVRTVSVMELEGGKIKRVSDYFNLAELQRQLGLIPEAAQPAT